MGVCLMLGAYIGAHSAIRFGARFHPACLCYRCYYSGHQTGPAGLVLIRAETGVIDHARFPTTGRYHCPTGPAIEASPRLITQRGEAPRPLFDEQLFHCRGKLLAPVYRRNQQKKSRCPSPRTQSQGKLAPSRTQHVCERIVHRSRRYNGSLATQHYP